MFKTEEILSSQCPSCHVHFICGAIGEEWGIIRQLNLKLVLWAHKNATPENCDGIVIGDIIDRRFRCTKCGADPFVTIEQEYADNCDFCEKEKGTVNTAYYYGKPNSEITYWVCENCASDPHFLFQELLDEISPEELYLLKCNICQKPSELLVHTDQNDIGICKNCSLGKGKHLLDQHWAIVSDVSL